EVEISRCDIQTALRGVLTRSFHLDVFSEISWHVEIFAFDNGWLTFFKAAAGDRLELQNFLFRLRSLVGLNFFFLALNRLLLRRNYERGWFTWHECRRRWH